MRISDILGVAASLQGPQADTIYLSYYLPASPARISRMRCCSWAVLPLPISLLDMTLFRRGGDAFLLPTCISIQSILALPAANFVKEYL